MSNPLHSIVIGLRVAEDCALSTTHGHLLHAAFMSMLKLVNPEPTQEMHDANERKPFTLSPLHNLGHGRNGRIRLHAGQACWFRATFTDFDVLRDFTTYFIQGHSTLRLNRAEFVVTEIHTAPVSHRLARVTTTDSLWSQWDSVALDDTHQSIALRFSSPTAFSFRGNHRKMYVLPDPVLVFSTLASYWDEMAGDQLQEAVQTFVPPNVVISYHSIKTIMLRFSDSPQIGFVGDVTYTILDETDPALVRHLNRLADLAFFTGLGSKVTMGMGQVSRIRG